MTQATKKKQRQPVVEWVQIDSISHDGRGVARVNDKVWFVDGALPGERVEAMVTRRRSQFNEARVLSVEQASDDRVTPPCEHFSVCGGCALQHIAPAQQVIYKEQSLRAQLQHHHVTVDQWMPALTGIDLGYRGRARLGIKHVPAKGGCVVGFRERYSPRYIANIDRCLVLDPVIGERITEFRQLFAGLSVCDRVPQLEIMVTGQQVALLLRHLADLTPSDRVTLQQFCSTYDMALYLQPAGIDSIHHAFGPRDLSYRLPDFDLTMHFQPTDFTQVNFAMNERMVVQACDWLGIESTDHIVDLFCGLGNFSLPLARRAASVTGVEGSVAMVNRARHNAQVNGITNAHFFADDLLELSDQASWRSQRFDKVLLDPPRCGAAQLIPVIAQMDVNTVLYVSCDAQTLVRDAKVLQDLGYRIDRIGVMDMFTHTRHVETMALFKRV
jgi:23S rRNA (uracil1939-C5)-methyltransferase